MKTYLPSCDNSVKYNAALAGGASAVIGYYPLTKMMGIPPVVHWALAGYAANQFCQGSFGSSAFQWEGPVWGLGGGLAAVYVVPTALGLVAAAVS